jgi:hypothetical protein
MESRHLAWAAASEEASGLLLQAAVAAMPRTQNQAAVVVVFMIDYIAWDGPASSARQTRGHRGDFLLLLTARRPSKVALYKVLHNGLFNRCTIDGASVEQWTASSLSSRAF